MQNSDTNFSNDPYEHFIHQQKYKQNLIQMDKPSKFAKKVNKLKQSLSNAKGNMLNGAMMGFMVGGLFGLVIGIYSVFQTRRLITIPMSVLVSGGSFAFILGCGSVLRNDTLINSQNSIIQNISSKVQVKQGQWIQIQEFNVTQKEYLNLYF